MLPDLPDLRAGVYEHYKGHRYLVLGYAEDASENPVAVMVVYVGLQLDGTPSPMRMRCRRAVEFHEMIEVEPGKRVRRFKYVGVTAF